MRDDVARRPHVGRESRVAPSDPAVVRVTGGGEDRRRGHLWSASRYPSMAPNLLPAIARLVNVAGVDPGDRVLDVGCGTGNAALTAHRAGANVAGVDITPEMLALADESAALARADVGWVRGDAESLPFPADAFEVVLSNFGHVFAPAPAAAAREMRRVARPGGRIGFTAWSPGGVVGSLTRLLDDRLEGPPSDPWGHLRWGEPSFVRERLDDVSLSFQRRILRFRYVSPEHFWREFAEESGPLSPALRGADDRAALREEALGVLEEWFGENAVRVEYLQVRGVVDGER